MIPDDAFLTISTPSESLFKDRGSKFLGFAYPVRSEEEVRNRVLALKELHPKAVHWCYAYRIGPGRYRANDDGEPSGSAGKPILNVLYSREVTNLLVVVVRYFGGTLLGVPGLIRAYKTATEMALDETGLITDFLKTTYLVTFPYDAMNAVMKAVKEMDLEIQKPVFDLMCSIEVEVRNTLAPEFLARCARAEGVTITPVPD